MSFSPVSTIIFSSYISACHMLLLVFTFSQNISYHVHITCTVTFIQGRGRGDGSNVGLQCFNICKRHTSRYLQGDFGHFPAVFLGQTLGVC